MPVKLASVNSRTLLPETGGAAEPTQLAAGGAWREVRRRYQPGQWAYYAYVVPPQVFSNP